MKTRYVYTFPAFQSGSAVEYEIDESMEEYDFIHAIFASTLDAAVGARDMFFTHISATGEILRQCQPSIRPTAGLNVNIEFVDGGIGEVSQSAGTFWSATVGIGRLQLTHGDKLTFLCVSPGTELWTGCRLVFLEPGLRF